MKYRKRQLWNEELGSESLRTTVVRIEQGLFDVHSVPSKKYQTPFLKLEVALRAVDKIKSHFQVMRFAAA